MLNLRILKNFIIIRPSFNVFMSQNHCRCFNTVTNKSKINSRAVSEGNETSNLNKTNPPRLNEQQFLVRLKNDPDLFGVQEKDEMADEGDLQEEKYFEQQPHPSNKLRTKQYADMIKDLIKKRKIKEALDVLEVRMLKEDRVKPENYIYCLLMGACGRVGYTKKAFSLYNNMKKRGLEVHSSTYTALFNACANSPWPEDGLARATHLRGIMIEKMYEPNLVNYNAMIKAFGRCGDMQTAFGLVDEMTSKKLPTKDDTINFLLQSCISDKDAGFRHALMIWRKMMTKRIKPSIYTFNLMLRCVRDCGIGNLDVMTDAINTILSQKSLKEGGKTKLLTDASENNENSIEGQQENSNLSECDVIDKLRPNLMAMVPHLGNIISLSEVNKPEDRLLLVGGMKGFLAIMEEHQCKPDIKTFTQLLDCLPGSMAAEEELLRTMKKLNLKPDVDFCNMLLKKRSMRFEYEKAKEVLVFMQELGHRPNLMTYGVLALGCKNKVQALELISEMKLHAYRLNVQILGAMLRQACYHENFGYVLEIMEICLREDIKPCKKFMECLSTFKNHCKEISNDPKNELSKKISFQKGLKIFLLRYKTWSQQVEVDETEETHPWTQFRQNTETDVRRYKDRSSRFKAKHLSLFKVKTSTKRKKY